MRWLINGVKVSSLTEDYHKYWYIDIETELIPPKGTIGVESSG